MSILALGRKTKKKKGRKGENSPIKEWEKAKKKENSQSKIGRKQKKYVERSLDQIISGQYCHQVNKKKERKPRPKMVFSL